MDIKKHQEKLINKGENYDSIKYVHAKGKNNPAPFIIMGMTAVTFFTRFSAPVLLKFSGLPIWLERWLKHVPTAILTALIVPSLFLPRGYLDLSLHNRYLIAGFITAIIACKTRNVILTIGACILIMFTLRWLGL